MILKMAMKIAKVSLMLISNNDKMESVRNQRILYEMIFGDVSYSMVGVL